MRVNLFKFLKLSLTVLLLAYCATLINLQQVWGLVTDIAAAPLFFAVGLVGVGYVAGALRFQTLSSSYKHLSLLTAYKQYFFAGFFNTVLPTSIGGDALRLMWLRKLGFPGVIAGSLIFIERLLGVFCLVILALIASSRIGEVAGYVEMLGDGVVLAKAFALVMGALLIALWLSRRQSTEVEQWWQKIIKAIQNITANLEFRTLCVAFWWAAVFQVINVLVTVMVADALQISQPLSVWFFVVPLVWLLTLMPVTLGGLGLREVAFVHLLVPFGLSAEEAISVALLTFICFALAGLVGGVFYLAGSLKR